MSQNPICEVCGDWCRPEVVVRKITNHHPDCPHYNDSLIDVWKVSDGTSSYFTLNEEEAKQVAIDAHEDGFDEISVTKEKIHKEVFDQLPEFDAF